MNKIYKLVWNAQRQTFIVTSEKAQSKGKLFLTNLLSVASLTLAMIPFSYAQCVNVNISNNSCGQKVFTEYLNSELFNQQSTNYISPYLSAVNFSNSVEKTISNHVESNDDGFNYSSTADVNNLTLNQPSGEIIGGKNGINLTHNGTGSTNITISGKVTGKQNDGIFSTNTINTQYLTIMELADASIRGKLNGINIANNGRGLTSISTSASVIGEENDGIVAINDGDTKGLTVTQSAGSIHGKKNGINADNKGKGEINISTSGEVIGDENEGINAVNEQNTSDLIIGQFGGSVKGNLNGIKANNMGNGSTNLTTSGVVIGQQNDGVYVDNESNTHELSVTQSSGRINGELNGINAINKGNGSTIVTTSGTVIGNQENGVIISNQANTKKLTFNQLKGNITGNKSGIDIVNNGNGITSISSYGDIEGQQKDGMIGINGVNSTDLNVNQALGNITGNVNGINMDNQGNGSTLITTTGGVTGKQNDGVYVINEVNTHELTINQASGNIHGLVNGINVTNKGNGFTLISASGNIIGDNSYGIVAVNETNTKDLNVSQPLGSIHGKLDGINVTNKGNGATTVSTSGQVIGEQEDGLHANAYENTNNLTAKQSSGRIYGKKNGIYFNNLGKGSTFINTSGEVVGDQNEGIDVINDIHSHDVNIMQSTSGSIKGNLNGINIANKGDGSTTVTSSGDIIGLQKNGLSAVNDQNTQDIVVSQLAGNIQGLLYGINMVNNGNGSASINTSGEVNGTQNDGIYALNNVNTGNLKISQLNGDIKGKLNGISLVNNGHGSTSITTLGKIFGEQEDGIFASNNDNTQDLTVIQSTGEINGKLNGINMLNNGQRSTILSIAGKVIGNTNDAVVAIGQSTTNNMIFGQTKDSEINGQTNGVNLTNMGQGSTGIKVAGKIVSQTLDALIVNNDIDTDNLSFKQEISGDINGAQNGINLTNQGHGFTHITSDGNIHSNAGDAILVANGNNTQDLTVELSTNSNITSSNNGINAINEGVSFTSVSTSANITGNNGAGISITNGNTATDLIIKQTSGVISGTDAGIMANNNGTGATEVDVFGKVIGQDGISGKGIYTSGKEGTKTYINLNEGADVSAASNIAIKNDMTDSTVSLNNGSKVSGEIRLGSGNDALIINDGADISQITTIDGGSKLVRVGGSSDIDKFNLNLHLTGSSTSAGTIGDIAILGWENITINGAGRLTLTGDLDTDKLTLDSGAVVELQNSLHQTQISGSVYNGGTITLSNAYAGDSMTIVGDYIGNNGNLVLDTVVQNSDSPTDKLSVNGNVSGNTMIQINNIDGLGADTSNTNGIELVHVDGVSTNDAFKMKDEHLDVGAYEYYLHKSDINNQNNNWYLRSYKVNNPDKPTDPGIDPQPEKPTDPSINPQPEKPIITPGVKSYRKEVPLFSAIPALLRQADNIMQSNMHQRIGNQPLVDSLASWGRIIAKRINLKQSGIANVHSKGNYTGLQLGSDFWQDNDWRSGAYFGYLHGDLSIDGFASGKNGRVGSNSIYSYFLGGYGTYMRNDGTYVDIVLQGAHHHVDVKPNSNKSSSQRGYGFSASVETGKPFNLSDSGWKLEPQAQIIHQWLYLNNSHISGKTTIKQNNNNAWLFRLGGRLEGNFQTQNGWLRPYTRVNLFYSPNGADRVIFASKSAETKFSNGAKYFSSEIAIGGSYEITNQISAYTEIGHTWTNGGKARVKSPVSGSIGVRASW